MSGPKVEEDIDPPTFRLPKNPDRFEFLWTVRLPRDVDPADLNGCRLQLDLQQDQEFASRNGKKHTFQWGDPVEVQIGYTFCTRGAVATVRNKQSSRCTLASNKGTT
jgi:hypothetical protein